MINKKYSKQMYIENLPTWKKITSIPEYSVNLHFMKFLIKCR